MRALAAAFCGAHLLLVATLASAGIPSGHNPYGFVTGGPATAGSTISTACATQPTGDVVCYDNNGASGGQRTANVAPQDLMVRPQTAFAGGAQTAADTNICGGQDETKIDIDDYTQGVNGDTVTVTVIDSNGASTANVLTWGTTWCASGCTSNALTATNLAAAIDALAGVSAAASSAQVQIGLDAGTMAVTLAESRAALTTVSTGTAGNLVFYVGGGVKLAAGPSNVDVCLGGTSSSFPGFLSNGASNIIVRTCTTTNRAGMTALSFQAQAGSAGAPGINVTTVESTTGLYSTGAGNMSGSVQSTQVFSASTVTWNHKVPMVDTVDSRTIAADGAGTPAALTLLPLTSYVEITCNDTDGCNITMSETTPTVGQSVVICNISANAVNFADTAGVSELAGAFAAGIEDCITMRYGTTTWRETGRSNN